MGGRDGFVEGFERGELRGEAAFGGCVNDEDDFAFERGEGVGLAFFFRGVSDEREGEERGVWTYCRGA